MPLACFAYLLLLASRRPSPIIQSERQLHPKRPCLVYALHSKASSNASGLPRALPHLALDGGRLPPGASHASGGRKPHGRVILLIKPAKSDSFVARVRVAPHASLSVGPRARLVAYAHMSTRQVSYRYVSVCPLTALVCAPPLMRMPRPQAAIHVGDRVAVRLDAKSTEESRGEVVRRAQGAQRAVVGIRRDERKRGLGDGKPPSASGCPCLVVTPVLASALACAPYSARFTERLSAF